MTNSRARFHSDAAGAGKLRDGRQAGSGFRERFQRIISKLSFAGTNCVRQAYVPSVGLLILLALALAACGSSSAGGAGTVVEQYFQAIVDGDEDRIATLSCGDWESSARADVAAFYGVEARLEGVACQPAEGSQPSADGSVIVECSGAIIATYDDEDSTFELAGRQMKVVEQDGDYLVCGYAE